VAKKRSQESSVLSIGAPAIAGAVVPRDRSNLPTYLVIGKATEGMRRIVAERQTIGKAIRFVNDSAELLAAMFTDPVEVYRCKRIPPTVLNRPAIRRQRKANGQAG